MKRNIFGEVVSRKVKEVVLIGERFKHVNFCFRTVDLPSALQYRFNEAPVNLELLFNTPEYTLREALNTVGGWSPMRHSSAMRYNPAEPFKIRRVPSRGTTDVALGAVCFDRGLHLWRFRWPFENRGLHPCVGVTTGTLGTGGIFLHRVEGCCNLVGGSFVHYPSSRSWGWNLRTCSLHFEGRMCGEYPLNLPMVPRLSGVVMREKISEEFFMLLDCDSGSLSFIANGKFLGEAFVSDEMKHAYLTPAISTDCAYAEVDMCYIGGVRSVRANPIATRPIISLRDLVRRKIRRVCESPTNVLLFCEQMNLSSLVRDYLLFL